MHEDVEVLPPVKRARGRPPKSLAVVPERTEVESVTVINAYYNTAKTCAAGMVQYAALCGMELEARKYLVGHGKWETWVKENCDFSCRSADRYMALAAGFRRQMGQSNLGAFLSAGQEIQKLLCGADQNALLSSIDKIANGRTLQQLYFDFGIIADPEYKPKGGYHPPTKDAPSAFEQVEHEHLLSRVEWDRLTKQLVKSGIERKTWTVLSRPEMEAILSALDEVAAEIRKVTK